MSEMNNKPNNQPELTDSQKIDALLESNQKLEGALNEQTNYNRALGFILQQTQESVFELQNKVAELEEKLGAKEESEKKRTMSESWNRLKNRAGQSIKSGWSGLGSALKSVAGVAAMPFVGVAAAGSYAVDKSKQGYKTVSEAAGKGVEKIKSAYDTIDSKMIAFNDPGILDYLHIKEGTEKRNAREGDKKSKLELDIDQLNAYKQNYLRNLDDQRNSGLNTKNAMSEESKAILLELEGLRDKQISMELSGEDTREIDFQIERLEDSLPQYMDEEKIFVEQELARINKELDKLYEKSRKIDSQSREQGLSDEYIDSVVLRAKELENSLRVKDNGYLESKEYKNSPLYQVLEMHKDRVVTPLVDEDDIDPNDARIFGYNPNYQPPVVDKKPETEVDPVPLRQNDPESYAQIFNSTEELQQDDTPQALNQNISPALAELDDMLLGEGVNPKITVGEDKKEEPREPVTQIAPDPGYQSGDENAKGPEDTQWKNLNERNVGRSKKTRLLEQQASVESNKNPKSYINEKRYVLSTTKKKLERNTKYDPDKGIRLSVPDGKKPAIEFDLTKGEVFNPNELPENFNVEPVLKDGAGYYLIKGFGGNTIQIFVNVDNKIQDFILKGNLWSGAKEVTFQKLKPLASVGVSTAEKDIDVKDTAYVA